MLQLNQKNKRSKPTIDLNARSIIGNVYGRLTVICLTNEKKFTRTGRHRGRLYLCRCECGKEILALPKILWAGRLKSCGCLRTQMGLDALPAEEAGLRRVVHQYKRNAKIRSIPFGLTKEQVKSLISAPCHYCGDVNTSTWRPNATVIFKCNGIDRKNNKLGYELDNCVSCCATCNRAKRDIDYSQFIKWIERLIGHIRCSN